MNLEGWWSLADAAPLSGCVIKRPPSHGSQPQLQKLLLSEEQQMQKLTAARDAERKWLHSIRPKWDSHSLLQSLENISENDEVRLQGSNERDKGTDPLSSRQEVAVILSKS